MKHAARAMLTTPFAAVLTAIYASTVWSETPNGNAGLPKPLVALSDRGLNILEKFDAPSGLTGYLATFQGRSMAVYLMPDG